MRTFLHILHANYNHERVIESTKTMIFIRFLGRLEGRNNYGKRDEKYKISQIHDTSKQWVVIFYTCIIWGIIIMEGRILRKLIYLLMILLCSILYGCNNPIKLRDGKKLIDTEPQYLV